MTNHVPTKGQQRRRELKRDRKDNQITFLDEVVLPRTSSPPPPPRPSPPPAPLVRSPPPPPPLPPPEPQTAKPTGGLLHSGTTIDTAHGEKWEGGESAWQGSGTSIFDPVLCELAYRWFCPSGGIVLDPFAGGSVRGIVAAKLGLKYVGIDLSARQLEANRAQAEAIVPENVPQWINGDSCDIEELAKVHADFVFSCPPYADLEVYSYDTRDLSTMSYDKFLEAYRKIIASCVRMLKRDRFACFVVGDVRDKQGCYRGFPWHTIQAFQDAGAKLYNEAILITSAGSLPVRVPKQFSVSRKLGKTHQQVYVFLKGEAREAAKACGEIWVAD